MSPQSHGWTKRLFQLWLHTAHRSLGSKRARSTTSWVVPSNSTAGSWNFSSESDFFGAFLRVRVIWRVGNQRGRVRKTFLWWSSLASTVSDTAVALVWVFFVYVIYVCFVLCSKVFESKRVGSLAVVLGDLLLGAATFRTQFRQPRFDMDSILEGTNLRSEKVKQGLSRSVNVTCLTCKNECTEM